MSRRNLAEDMEIDILLRLPVKSLVRFRCVSKYWCARFQNPLFINNHYIKHTTTTTTNYDYDANVSVLVLRRDGHIHPRQENSKDVSFFSLLDNETLSVKENIYLSFPVDNYTFDKDKVMDLSVGDANVIACNGLICLYNYHQITLWNPATREFKHLPESHIQRPPKSLQTMYHTCGFGFDSKTDDYKVICIFYNNIDTNIEIQTQSGIQMDLYTLSTDSWREVQTPAEDLSYEIPICNTYINGVFHWGSCWGSSWAPCIIAFDMADELFSMLTLPNLPSMKWYPGVLNGSLAIFSYPCSWDISNCDIWVMKEYGVTESWTKLLTIRPNFGTPLEFWRNGLLFCEADRQLVLYDPNTQEIEKLQVHSRSSAQIMVFIYVESLVSINGRREHEDERFIRLSTRMGDA